MKKSISVIILLITMCFILTGCVSKGNRGEVLKALEKENYIKSDWELIDETTEDGLFASTNYMYIYEDSKNKLYAVVIDADSEDEEKLYASVYENTVQNKILKSKNDEDEEEYTYLYERGDLVKKLILKKGSLGSWKIEEE